MADNKYSLRSPGSQNRGCWFAVSRCFNSKPVNKSTEPIEFENLVTAEKRVDDVKRKSQVVTMEEREHIMSGNYQQLLDEQEQLDQERANELRRQEEALRMEEEAYFAAKRGASRREQPTQQVTVSQTTTADSDSGNTGRVDFTFPSDLSPPSNVTGSRYLKTGQRSMGSEMGPWTSAVANKTSGHRLVAKDEDDFDKFLESVKAKQISLTTKDQYTSPISDSEEEVDFGFWEKASSSLPALISTDKSKSLATQQLSKTKEVDLDLL